MCSEWANVPWEWDPMGMGLELPNVPWKGTSQCAPGMGLSNVPWEWDYPMCSGKELANAL